MKNKHTMQHKTLQKWCDTLQKGHGEHICYCTYTRKRCAHTANKHMPSDKFNSQGQKRLKEATTPQRKHLNVVRMRCNRIKCNKLFWPLYFYLKWLVSVNKIECRTFTKNSKIQQKYVSLQKTWDASRIAFHKHVDGYGSWNGDDSISDRAKVALQRQAGIAVCVKRSHRAGAGMTATPLPWRSIHKQPRSTFKTSHGLDTHTGKWRPTQTQANFSLA